MGPSNYFVGKIILVTVLIFVTVGGISWIIITDSPVAIPSQFYVHQPPPASAPLTIDCIPNISSFSGWVTTDDPNNTPYGILPCNNNNCDRNSLLTWDSAADGTSGSTPLPIWVIFDFGYNATVIEFQFSTYGDGTHDVTKSALYTSSSNMGPWTLIKTFTSPAGTNFLHYFLITPTTARFFQWLATETESGYQPYVKCTRFVTTT